LTAVDVVGALARRGFTQEAENILFMLQQRVCGDYLQTSSIFRDGAVLNALNDPNDYRGPGTGYRMSPERWDEVKAMRRITTREKVRAEEQRPDTAAAPWLVGVGKALKGEEQREVVIGVSPAFGKELQRTTAGHDLVDVILALTEGVKD